MLPKDDLMRFEKRLEAARNDLKEQIASLAENPEFGSDVDHFEEEADEAEEYSKNLGIEKTLKERLENVEHALGKMAGGTYGVCESCGGEISSDVLNVDPESRLCKTCKSKDRT
ncbi:MAG: TraR/DksA C4-type zinc finger protein [Patescibacteria group bacterium]